MQCSSLFSGLPCEHPSYVLPPMALASCKHAPHSPPAAFMADFISSSLKEGLPSRVTFLQRAAIERRLGEGSPGITPQAIKAPFRRPSVSAPEVSVVESPAQRTQMWHAMETAEDVGRDEHLHAEFLLTELKRSQLENLWACTEEQNHITHRQFKQGKCTRLSARQRRVLSRRLENGRKNESHCTSPERHADALSASRGRSMPNDGAGSLLGAIRTVSTLGYLNGRVSKELLTKEEEALLAKKMKVGQNLRAARERLKKAMGHEPCNELWALSVKLSYKELQAKLLEADQARDYMFLANLRLVVSVAKKYSSLGINLEDLTQEGAAGLLRGLEKFNYKKGFKLSTYVHWWIRQGVTQALGQHSKTVRIPPYMYAKMTLVTQTIAKFKESGIPVSVTSLSAALNMSEDVVSVVLKLSQASKKIISLDKPKNWGGFSPEGDSLHHYVADPRVENDPWKIVDNMSLREQLDVLITSTLCEREQQIVRLYYGFECPKGHGVSYHKIGQRMGISRERARQLEGRALRKLIVAGRHIDLSVPLTY